ncbi:putative thiamine transporter SLC35F3a [Denticeps clupeoides]|uniref:putative thiamine transporter SLC35F3a n=1 Tax=Denticeps clupeoides TaxID=299321 RepID=UPI0010A41B71|nr:putative thiamine transporter SLC35F3 [Denticeps clupeoides]
MRGGDAEAATCTPTSIPSGRVMKATADMSPRRLSDISPQLHRLKSLVVVVDEDIKEDLRSSRSVEDMGKTSIEERILRITGYYGYQPWSSSFSTEDKHHGNITPGSTSDTCRPSNGGGGHAQRKSRKQSLQSCLYFTAIHLREALWGVVLVICVSSSWCGSTQLAKLIVRGMNAPMMLTWFSTSWNCLVFPVYYLGHLSCSRHRQTPREKFRECCQLFGDEGVTLRALLARVAPFGLLWALTGYLYLQGLRRIPATDASALFCCSRAFAFLLSWIGLRERFMGVRIVAAILAIAGIVMMTYADGFHSYSVIGISLVVGSASTTALHKVLFKLHLGNVELGEAAVFLTVLGGTNLVFVGALLLLLFLIGAEDFGSVPWTWLCGMAGLLLVFNFLLNFGGLATLPTLISLGVVLGVPINAVIDRCAEDIQFNSVRVIALSIICLGFLLLLFPEDWDDCLLHQCFLLYHHKRPKEGASEMCTDTAHIRASVAGNSNAKLMTEL